MHGLRHERRSEARNGLIRLICPSRLSEYSPRLPTCRMSFPFVPSMKGMTEVFPGDVLGIASRFA